MTKTSIVSESVSNNRNTKDDFNTRSNSRSTETSRNKSRAASRDNRHFPNECTSTSTTSNGTKNIINEVTNTATTSSSSSSNYNNSRNSSINKDEIRKQANLRLLQRTCNAGIVDIVTSATHVVLYEWVGTNWDKCNVEGSLFVVVVVGTNANSTQSGGDTNNSNFCSHQLIVMNRSSPTNFQMDITSQLKISNQDPYLILKAASEETTATLDEKKNGAVLSNSTVTTTTSGLKIRGIWFHNADERIAVNKVLQETVNGLSSSSAATTPSTSAENHLVSTKKSVSTLTTMTPSPVHNQHGQSLGTANSNSAALSYEDASSQSQPTVSNSVNTSNGYTPVFDAQAATATLTALLFGGGRKTTQSEEEIEYQDDVGKFEERIVVGNQNYASHSQQHVKQVQSSNNHFTGKSATSQDILTAKTEVSSSQQPTITSTLQPSLSSDPSPINADLRSSVNNTSRNSSITSGASNRSASATPNSMTSNQDAMASTGAGVALDKKSLQLALLSLIQDDRFLDLLHSQYLRVIRTRVKKQHQNNENNNPRQEP